MRNRKWSVREKEREREKWHNVTHWWQTASTIDSHSYNTISSPRWLCVSVPASKDALHLRISNNKRRTSHTAAEAGAEVLNNKKWQNECGNLAIKSNEKWLFHFVETILWFYVFLHFILWLLPIFLSLLPLVGSHIVEPHAFDLWFSYWFYRRQCNEFVATGSAHIDCCNFVAAAASSIESTEFMLFCHSKRSSLIFFIFFIIIRCSPFNASSIQFSTSHFFLPSPHQCDTGNWNNLLEYSWKSTIS